MKIQLDDTESEKRQLDSLAKFIINIHHVICDKFTTELIKQKVAYIKVEEKFGFLFNKKK